METNTKTPQAPDRHVAEPTQADPAAVLAELLLGEAPVSGAPLEEKQCPQVNAVGP